MIGRGSTAPLWHPSGYTRVVDVTLYCSHRDHEIRLITDGRSAYAAGPTTSCPDAYRDARLVFVDCGQPGADDEPCPGQVVADLADPDLWSTADYEELRLLALGQELHR